MAVEVLVTDDDPVVSHILTSILESTGYKVQVAQDAAQCFQILHSCAQGGNCPAVIFLDVMLPDMNGLDVLKKIRELYPAVPVIMLSANSQRDMLEIQPDFAPDFYLEKPFVAETVHSALRAVLERSS